MFTESFPFHGRGPSQRQSQPHQQALTHTAQSNLLAPGQRGGAASLRGGGIIAILPGGRIIVLNCVVTHPAAALYVQGTSQLARFAASKAETHQRRAFELFGDGASYEFLLLADDSFERLGKEAARFLHGVGEVAVFDACASSSTLMRPIRQESGCALCRGNARKYDRSLLALARGVGKGLCPAGEGSSGGW